MERKWKLVLNELPYMSLICSYKMSSKIESSSFRQGSCLSDSAPCDAAQNEAFVDYAGKVLKN